MDNQEGHVHGDECVGMYRGEWLCEMSREGLLEVIGMLKDWVNDLHKSLFEMGNLVSPKPSDASNRFKW